MSDYILEQAVDDIKASRLKISLQVDKSIDVSNCCQLLVLVRISSICSDGAPAMLGNRSGFAALMRKEIPDLNITYCYLYRQALAAKTLPTGLKKTLEICVKIVNIIRGRALNHRLFQSFCEEVGQEHTVLLYHTEQFLHGLVQVLEGYFHDPEFVPILAYLVDVFTALNELNRSLQRRGMNILIASEKLATFKDKIVLCIRIVKKGNLASFPSLEETILCTAFNDYFFCGELQPCDDWIRHSFKENMEDVDLNSNIKKDLIELRNNRGIQLEIASGHLEHFWASQLESYPALTNMDLTVLVTFATTYRGNTGFSCQLHIKTKSRNRLDPQHDIRVAISTNAPRFDASEMEINSNKVSEFGVQP
ncbi:unnamed protein product [Lepeophtheirus salmonis]|uniref:(salmon louse) hypothetical protein n=1 Tax=Lepeophtheirus salmonis TaxID=72036 RepID=A0A7R8CTQ7_LEPSM|nr:unnamed protein product [Lepeophtheirus salmonis]CAF2875734.1 unnamed protein product [Lepeophtheirus salmonis]